MRAHPNLCYNRERAGTQTRAVGRCELSAGHDGGTPLRLRSLQQDLHGPARRQRAIHVDTRKRGPHRRATAVQNLRLQVDLGCVPRVRRRRQRRIKPRFLADCYCSTPSVLLSTLRSGGRKTKSSCAVDRKQRDTVVLLTTSVSSRRLHTTSRGPAIQSGVPGFCTMDHEA